LIFEKFKKGLFNYQKWKKDANISLFILKNNIILNYSTYDLWDFIISPFYGDNYFFQEILLIYGLEDIIYYNRE
jgi:hypothetical protein